MIEQEFSRREGQVFVLSKLESRKPPTIAPNWRTSYRLNCSALCAIGRLDVAHAPLQPSFAINWAEIVPVSTAQGNDEGQNRSRGRMAVRLLGQSDCSALQGRVDLRVGTRIFVIDLRVFAPEVLPVLSTYANPTQIEDFESIAKVFASTDDGSHGFHGMVTGLLESLLASGEVKPGEIVFCCGPDPMMLAVAALCEQRGLRCFLSLETYMACGYGVCNGCTVHVQGERFGGWPYSKTCIEGPVYEACELVHDDA